MLTAISTEQLTKAGISFDTAIPQAAFDLILQANPGKHLAGNFVYLYPKVRSEETGKRNDACEGLLPCTFDGAQYLQNFYKAVGRGDINYG